MKFLFIILFGIILFSQSLIMSFGQWTDYNEHDPGTKVIPDWIRNNAAWWADGSIDDQTFVSGIEFLIKEGTISIPATQAREQTGDGIPDWIRSNAAWWADNMISDFDFVKGIEYLVGSGTIKVQTSSQIDPPSLELNAGPSDYDVESENTLCLGNARCISGTVTKIVDGDTIQVDDEIIRFALVDAPKIKYDGGQSLGFIEQICPVGSTTVVDQDDKQLEDKYGRLLGVVYCNDMNLNKELLDLGLGDLYSAFCDQSEFSTSKWALKHGCEPISELASPTNECDSSYPDFCIPPPPPDLNCADIPQTNFTVLQPDPHGFDRDQDGIGCES